MTRKQPPTLPEPGENDVKTLAALELDRRGEKLPEHLAGAALFEGKAALGPTPPWVTVDAVSSGASFVAVDVVNDEPWLVRGYLRVAEEGFVISRVGVERFQFGDTGHGARLEEAEADVTGKVLRGVRLGEIRERAVRRLQERGIAYGALERTGWDLSAEEFEQARRLAEAARELPRTRGRKGYPPDHYRRIAIAYIDDIREHGSRGVLDRLARAERFERPTIRDWIKRARELGFLAPTKQGRAEARPGPNLYPKEEQ
jgi:hypothetical protein